MECQKELEALSFLTYWMGLGYCALGLVFLCWLTKDILDNWFFGMDVKDLLKKRKKDND